APHAVEPDAAAHALVDVEEVADVQPLPDGAVECESGVLAAAPAQGVDHRQLPTAFRTAPTSTFWPEPTVTVAGMSRSSAKSIAASVTISSVYVPGSRYRNSASKTRSPSASISSSSSALPSAFVSLARKSASVSCRPLRIGSFTESASARDTTMLPLSSSSVALITGWSTQSPAPVFGPLKLCATSKSTSRIFWSPSTFVPPGRLTLRPLLPSASTPQLGHFSSPATCAPEGTCG